MNIILLCIGLFLIGSGFLVKKYPNLIAGYNDLDDEQKKSVDVQRLSSFLRSALIIIGVVVACIGPILGALGLEAYVTWWFLFIVIVGTGVMAVKAQSY